MAPENSELPVGLKSGLRSVSGVHRIGQHGSTFRSGAACGLRETRLPGRASVTDNGKTGTFDTISINLRDGHSAGCIFVIGEIRIH